MSSSQDGKKSAIRPKVTSEARYQHYPGEKAQRKWNLVLHNVRMYNTTTKEKGIKIWQKSSTEHLTSATKHHGIKMSSGTQMPVNLLNTLSDAPSPWPCMIKLQMHREQPCTPLELWHIHCKTEQPFATFYCKVNDLEVLPVCVYSQFNVLKKASHQQ